MIKVRNQNQNKFSSTSFKFIFPFIILVCMTHITFDYQLQKSRKFSQKCTNGNQNIKIVHWNKGSANFSNRIHQINSLISDQNPHILALREANLNIIENGAPVKKHLEYNIEANKMSQITGISRNIILIKDGINYTRRYDLEDINTSTVWIEIKLSKGKPVLIGSIYRQWSLPSILNVPNSKSNSEQTNRWSCVLEK